MRTVKYLFILALLPGIFAGCTKDFSDDTSFVESGQAPAQLSALFEITQDNSGTVTITPNGEGAVSYDVYFGDHTAAPVQVNAGKNATHNYAEGVYNVKLVGHSINGKTTEATKQLTVSFRAPENLEVTATTDPANHYKVTVSAKASYETNFNVYFGDVANEIPVSFNEGDVVNHTYSATGRYTVKVVALSGGAATTEATKTVTIVDPVLLPLTFESPTINYAFNGFDGGNVTVVTNPHATGLNTSGKVGQMVKGAGQPWGGSVITLGAPIDFSVNKVFRMNVYSPRVGAKVLLKVEDPANSAVSFEKEVTTTLSHSWEDLVFDYAGIDASKTYQNLVLIFDNGTMGDGSANFTFLFDDIRLTNVLPSAQLTLPVTFDNPNVSYTVADFGGNVTVDAADPANASNKVKKTTKPNGAQTWAGTTVGTAGFATPFPLTATATKMRVRVYSPAAGLPVRLKLEEKTNNTHSVETDAVTTVANAWETLVFDFSAPAAGTPALNLSYGYNVASLFFDFGAAGSGKTFYWDDLDFVTAAPAVLGLPLDFESATVNYAFTDFDGGRVTVVNNPHATGLNASSKVGQMVKNAGQTWGGSYIALPNPIDFSTKKLVKMNVFSPRVGAKVLLKVENLTNGGISFEKEVTTTVANAWEELAFDYSAINTANSYQKVVLIFDNGTAGDGSANFTFLFDDIRLQ